MRGESAHEIETLLPIQGREERRGRQQVVQQPLAGELVQRGGEGCELARSRFQRGAIEFEEIRVPQRGHGGGARCSGHERHLAEDGSLVQPSQLDDVALVGAHATLGDPHLARGQDEERAPGLALGDHHTVGRGPKQPHGRQHRAEGGRRELAEHGDRWQALGVLRAGQIRRDLLCARDELLGRGRAREVQGRGQRLRRIAGRQAHAFAQALGLDRVELSERAQEAGQLRLERRQQLQRHQRPQRVAAVGGELGERRPDHGRGLCVPHREEHVSHAHPCVEVRGLELDDGGVCVERARNVTLANALLGERPEVGDGLHRPAWYRKPARFLYATREARDVERVRPWELAVCLVCVTLGVSSRASAQEACEDEALSALAARHALDHLSASELLSQARASGASYPSLHLVTLADDDLAARASWLRALAGRGLGPLHCGEALTETSRIVVAAPAQGSIERVGDQLRVELTPGFREPVVYVRAAGAEPVAVPVEAGIVVLDLHAIEAPTQLQLVATGPDGPRPIAELALSGEVSEAPLPEDGSLLTLLRARAGAGALRPNRILGRLAEEHAERVCALGHVAHEVGDTGNAEERLRGARLSARHVGEVVARASDEPATWRALARSPSHRAALGDRRFTDVGLGEAQRGGHRCLVVILAAWPRRF